MAALHDSLNLFTRQFALALQRSTRLRPGGPLAAPEASEADLRGSARHLPGVGWIVGLLCAFVFAVFALVLRGNPGGPLVAAVASLLAGLALTGGAQESGLFRAVEGIEAPLPGATGTAGHGAIALVLLLLAKAAVLFALGSVTEPGVLAALFAAAVLSRFAPLLATHWLGNGQEADRAGLRVAALWCVPPVLLALLAEGLAFLLLALLGVVLAWVGTLRFLRNRPQPFGEDRAAALQQACELGFYVGAAVAA